MRLVPFFNEDPFRGLAMFHVAVGLDLLVVRIYE